MYESITCCCREFCLFHKLLSHKQQKAAEAAQMHNNGSDTDVDGVCERVCKKQACAIQFCLQQRSYQEHRCADVIKRYYDCCDAAKRALQQQAPQQDR